MAGNLHPILGSDRSGTDVVVTPTDAGGERLAERTVSAAPTLGEAAEFGAGHRTDYVSVRHGETITVGGSAKVSRNGIACVKRRLSCPGSRSTLRSGGTA
ncbi:hypothetical protein [Actinacidiphila glaucinigra]|uniref:hypothetical protein n=1 Tax=Actinacidiphila glaucinigra TaxID=235986 RepID=UPI003D8BF53D